MKESTQKLQSAITELKEENQTLTASLKEME